MLAGGRGGRPPPACPLPPPPPCPPPPPRTRRVTPAHVVSSPAPAASHCWSPCAGHALPASHKHACSHVSFTQDILSCSSRNHHHGALASSFFYCINLYFLAVFPHCNTGATSLFDSATAPSIRLFTAAAAGACATSPVGWVKADDQ